MPAAFDTEGRLKKHALRGTSLASDPTRAVERGQFKELHAEAKTKGWGRKQMTAQLTDRYKTFAGEQQRSLADIARKKGLAMDKYESRNLGGDEALEEDFSRYNAGVRSEEFDVRTKSEWRGQDLRVSEVKSKASKKDMAAWTDYAAEHGKNAWSEKSYKNWAERKNKKSLASFRKPQWEEQAGLAAQNREENRINDEIAKINETYIPLEQNQAQRQARLRSRMEMYNMFLGS